MLSTIHKLIASCSLIIGAHGIAFSQITGELPLPFPGHAISTDFNRDGKADYVYTVDDTVFVVTMTGFIPLPLFSMIVQDPGTLGSGDINLDGFPELLLTNAQQIRYIQNDNGAPGTIIEATPSSLVYWTEVADYDLDGDGDLLVNIHDIDISVIENVNGAFDFNAKIFLTNTHKEEAYTTGHHCDYDQDGLPDVLIYNEHAGVLILMNRGELLFEQVAPIGVRGPKGFDIDDNNGDGYPDVFLQHRRSFSSDLFSMQIASNDNGATFDYQHIQLPIQPTGMDVLDVNQDLVPDVVMGNQESIGVLYATQDTFEFQLLWGALDTIDITGPLPPLKIDVVDFDGDGLLDIIHVDQHGVGRIFTTNWIAAGPEYSCEDLANPLDCPPGDVVLTRQSEVDSFLLLYPNCTSLNGGLILTGDIHDVAPLRQLVRIGGALHIEQTAVTSLDPLNVFFVHGNATVKDNAMLSAITLEELFEIQGDLWIEHNEAAATINLDNVGKITNDFMLTGHPVLTRFETMHSLTTVRDVEISNNDQLLSIIGFDYVFLDATIYRIINNPALDTIIAFSNGNASSDLLIDGSPVHYAAVIGGIGTFTLRNVAMNTMALFDKVYPWQLILENVSGLESLEGLDSYLHYLSVTACPELTSLNIDLTVGNLELRDNPSLLDLSGVTFSSNGLDDLILINNKSLISMASLPDLTRINNKLHIAGNASLTEIKSLMVADVSSMDSLIIADNVQLTTCDADIICDYMESHSTYRIEGNAFGCQDPSAVLATCGAVPPFNPKPTDDPGSPTPFPNPADGNIWSGGHDIPASMRLYDHTGRLVKTVLDSNKLNVKEQQNGWYYLISAYVDRIECGMIIIAH